jgi:hypothetical protein
VNSAERRADIDELVDFTPGHLFLVCAGGLPIGRPWLTAYRGGRSSVAIMDTCAVSYILALAMLSQPINHNLLVQISYTGKLNVIKYLRLGLVLCWDLNSVH